MGLCETTEAQVESENTFRPKLERMDIPEVMLTDFVFDNIQPDKIALIGTLSKPRQS